jgi:hypothetical protein
MSNTIDPQEVPEVPDDDDGEDVTSHEDDGETGED